MKCLRVDDVLCFFFFHYNFVQYVCTINDFSYLITHTWSDAIVLHEKKKQQTLLQCGPCSFIMRIHICANFFLSSSSSYARRYISHGLLLIMNRRKKERQNRESKENNGDRIITMWATNKEKKLNVFLQFACVYAFSFISIVWKARNKKKSKAIAQTHVKSVDSDSMF